MSILKKVIYSNLLSLFCKLLSYCHCSRGKFQRCINTTMLPWLVEHLKQRHLKSHALPDFVLAAPTLSAQRRDVPPRTAKPVTARRALQKPNWLQKFNCQRAEELKNARKKSCMRLHNSLYPKIPNARKNSMPGSAPPALELGRWTRGKGLRPALTPTALAGAQKAR